jgi:L-alanine-DL-glutamate epimerase-like enolase superfamily enzyme
VSARGTIAVSNRPGLGYDIKKDLIEKLTVRKETLQRGAVSA